MVKNRNKLGMLALIAMVGVVSLTACVKDTGKEKNGEPKLTKDDYVKMYNSKLAEVDSLNDKLESVKHLLYSFDPTLAEVQDLSSFTVLPTGITAYNEIGNKISFDSKLALDQSVVVPNESKVNITNNVSFTPSKNWTFSLGNGSVTMNHINGIYGDIEVVSYNGQSNAYNIYENIINPHLQDIQAEQLNKKVVFLGENSGIRVESRIYVKEAIKSSIETTKNESKSDTESEAESSIQETVESANETTGETNESVSESTESNQETVENTDNANEKIVPYRYVCGVVMGNYSEIPDALVFKFFYPESSNVVSSTETIDTVLKSILMGGNYITLE